MHIHEMYYSYYISAILLYGFKVMDKINNFIDKNIVKEDDDNNFKG